MGRKNASTPSDPQQDPTTCTPPVPAAEPAPSGEPDGDDYGETDLSSLVYEIEYRCGQSRGVLRLLRDAAILYSEYPREADPLDPMDVAAMMEILLAQLKRIDTLVGTIETVADQVYKGTQPWAPPRRGWARLYAWWLAADAKNRGRLLKVARVLRDDPMAFDDQLERHFGGRWQRYEE